MKTISRHVVSRFLIVSACALLLPAGNAMAQTAPRGEDGPNHMRHEMGQGMHHGAASMLRRLGLSADQQKQFRLLHDSQQDAMRPLMRSLREERISLRELVSSDQYDTKKASEISEKIGQLHGKLALAMAEGHRKMLALLTPEQREKAKNLPFGRSERH